MVSAQTRMRPVHWQREEGGLALQETTAEPTFWTAFVDGRLPLASRLEIGLAVSLLFAMLAWRMRAVNLTGAGAGLVISAALFATGTARPFALLVLVFGLTWAATRFGRSRKQSAGIAERRTGRGARQVLANLGVGALACASFGVLQQLAGPAAAQLWQVALVAAFVASMVEATADTVSSEIGQAASPRAWLLISSRWVPAGTDGAVTVLGTLAGACSGAVIAAAAFWLGIVSSEAAVCAGSAGLLGTLFDTMLGGTFERRGALGNNAVNFLSTAFAALLAVWWCH